MEMTLISDTLTTLATKHTLTITTTLSSSLTTFITTTTTDHHLQIITPIDAIAPPTTIKPRTAPKRLARKRHRLKRTSKTNGDEDHTGDQNQDQDSGGFFDGGDGPFGGGGGAGGGNGGGGFGGFNWDESLPESKADPAFDFVYGVLCWVVFSNCLHFAFKKVMRIVSVTDGVSEPGRQKVRFTGMC